jgi:hypothetical protein
LQKTVTGGPPAVELAELEELLVLALPLDELVVALPLDELVVRTPLDELVVTLPLDELVVTCPLLDDVEVAPPVPPLVKRSSVDAPPHAAMAAAATAAPSRTTPKRCIVKLLIRPIVM